MSDSNTLFQSYLDAVYISSHSKNTVEVYTSALRHLEKFTAQNYQCDLSLLLLRIREKQTDVYRFLRDFIIYLDKAGLSPSSIKTWAAGVKGFFMHHEIKIYTEDFKQSVRMPKDIHHREEPITKDILVRLLRNANPRLQVMILIAVASGMRIGEIVQLKTSDIEFESKPAKIRIRAETTKGKARARESFLTSEASSALQDYLKRTFGWDKNSKQDRPIFEKLSKNTKHDTKSLSGSFISSLKRCCSEIPDLTKRNENGRRAIHFHGFRKYFRTVVGDACGRDFAEALLGHRFYMDTYYNLPEAKKREYYLKAEPYLTISDYTEIERKLEQNKESNKEIEILVRKIISERFPIPPRIMDLVINEKQ